MPHARNPRVTLTELGEDFVRFTLSGTDTSMANALRRIMIAEVRASSDWERAEKRFDADI
jgi:DNA-directed RNA polymerase II subunit RPB3